MLYCNVFSQLTQHHYRSTITKRVRVGRFARSGVRIIEIKYVRLFSFAGVRALATMSEIGCFLQLAHDYWIPFLRTDTVHNVYNRLAMVSDL